MQNNQFIHGADGNPFLNLPKIAKWNIKIVEQIHLHFMKFDKCLLYASFVHYITFIY